MGLATVTEVKGNVFVKDIAGNITKLQAGDVIESGQIVFGADEGASYTVSFSESGKEQTFAGIAPQLFDVTMVPSLADVEETAVHPASANPFAQSIMSPEELAALVAENDDKGEEVSDETTAGQEAPKDGESTGDTFADRTGAQTDVNSDLRKAKFFGVSHDYKQEDVFHREDVYRLGSTTNQNQIIPIVVTPTPPAPTPPIAPTPEPTFIPLRGILNLSGDITVAEGGNAYYTLSVDNAPKTALHITVSIGHITTEDGDLLPRTITVTIPAGSTSATFPIENNIDTIYEGPEDYKVSIVSTSGGGYNELSIGNSSVTTTIEDVQILPTLTINDQTINEQEGTMTFTVTLSEIATGNVTFNYATSDVSATAGADYSSVSGMGTIIAGTLTTTITVPIHDDYIADDGETFNVILSNPSANATIADGVGVGTILDDTGTPSIPNDGVEPNHEGVIIKLFAADENGNVITDGSGNYLQANSADEVSSGVAKYIAYAFDQNETVFSDATRLSTQVGQVEVEFTDGTATGINASSSSSTDGSEDYNKTAQTIRVGEVFSTDIFKEATEDGGETFTVALKNGTYATYNGNGYEGIEINTDPVTTTIKERLYAQIEVVDNEANEGEQLTYKLTIVDRDGNPVTVTSDAEVHLVYTGYGANPADSNDYTQAATVTVINGTSSKTFTLDTTDDYFAEGNEQLQITISEIIYNNNNFSIKPYTVANDALSDKDTVSGTIKDNPANTKQPDSSGTPDDPANGSYGADDTVYVKITHNDSVYEGNTLTHTVALVDKAGNPVTVPVGETITVTLTYNPDTTVNADFDVPKTTTVTISGGNSSVNVTNNAIDDFTSEGNESYTVTITDVSQNQGTYENVAIHATENSVTGTIQDGVTLGVPTNASVDEDNFDMEHNVITITDTQLLNITAPSGDNGYSLLFDGNPTFTSGNAGYTSLSSDGTPIQYVVSGNTTTAYAGSGRTASDKVFVITLDKNGTGGANDSYTYTQYKNIDHPIVDVDDDVVLTFGYKISDQGQTSSVQTFTVTVNDSMPSGAAQNITLDEDGSKTIYISDESFAGGNITLNNGVGADQVVAQNGTIDIYDNTVDQNVVGTLKNNGDGTLTFTPTANYSGTTAGFTYGVSDGDGDTATATISISVNPIADKPDMNGANAGLNGSTIKTTPQVLEDNNNNVGVEGGVAYTATIGLILPQISDHTDQTAANSNDDQPEKLGLITLKSSTIETITAGGIDYVVDSSGLTIFINDIPNYHYAGLGAGDADISLTQAEFAAIVVKFENDNAVNPKFTVSVDEYEVNDDNTIDLSVPKASNSQGYEVDILAVTDPITLAWDATGGLGVISTSTNTNDTFTFTTVDEGVAVIDLKALLTKTSGLENDADGDLDGSEHRSYTITGIPEGTIITLGGKSVAAGSDGIATISFPDNTADDPTFTMTINEQYSGTINGTITLNVTDSDSDSSGTITTESASVNFTMTINPIADQVTLKVAQAQGDEDAGRTHGNDEANNSTIDAPQNGIALNINVISDDNKDIGPNPINLKETYTVMIDQVPDGGSLYVYDNSDSSWKLVSVSDDGTSVTIDGNSVLTSGNISVDATAVGTYKVTIADYQNDMLTKFIPPYNSDADYTFDVTAYSMDNGASGIALAQTLQIDVTVEGIADIPVHDDLTTDTATDDDSDSNAFTIVSAEDSGNINLKDAFTTPDLLDSNDGDGTETLTFKVTGLADGFSVNGATFIGGSGENRVWLVDKAALNAGTVTLSAPVNYAGEVDFKIQFVTTENSGDSKTHPEKTITMMITPVAEAAATVNLSDTQDEDTAKALNFGFSTPDTDGASAGHESLQSFSIDMSTVPAGVILVGSVSGTLSGAGYVSLNVTNGVLETVTAILPQDSDADYSFKISYTYQDVAVDSHGNTYTDTVTKTDQVYSVTVNAITDDISLAMSTTATDAGITDNAGHVTVTANGSFTKTLTVTGIDSDGRGSPDTDGSEQFTRVTVSGVPEGITVGGVYGTYAGDTGGGNYSGFWYVDIPNDALDPSGTYNLVFDVDGSFADNLPDYPITVTAYSEDASNGVEQSDSQSFILTIDNAIVGPGPGTPATITQFYQDIDNDGMHDHAYLVETTTDTTITDADAYPNSVLREDTQFQLSDVIHVETDTGSASSTAFSITLKNVPAGVIVEGMTLNANGFYTLSGSGDQNAIVAKLQSILITPALNQNTDANNISNTDLAFDIELTTYAAGGASNTALINFSGSVLPVTDEMNLSVVNDGSTNEDTDQTFSITLGEGADGANTQIVDGKVYIKLTENYSDLQGGDGTNGSLSYNGNPIVVTAVSGVSGIADGNYYVITGVTNNQTLNFTYTPALNRDGSITVDTYVKNVESENWNPYDPAEIVSHESFSFDVNAVTDGFTLASATATGNEDGMIPLGITLTSSDSSEKIASVSISGVPNGFLLYYGANAGSAVIAQNLGTTGTTTSIEMTYGNPENVYVNTWNIPLSGGALPAYIGIKAPDNWSGTIPTITINSVDEDGNSSSDTLDITINPVVDTLTLNTTKTFGDEGDDILLNLNANVQDLDGSETVKLELTGLGADASFKANGIEIDSAHISYVGDTYTITNIAASDINALSFVQSAMNGNVNVSAYMVESDGSTSGAVNSSFNVNIAAVYPTGGDDTLLYKGSAIDGGAGTDTLIFKNIDTIDLSGVSNIANIEKMDMSGNGNQTLSGLSLDQIFSMTDSSSAHTLTIDGNTGDTVASVDKTGWAKAGETTVGGYTEYSYTKGTDTVTVKIDTDHLTNSTNLH